jgi:hypothetical protein
VLDGSSGGPGRLRPYCDSIIFRPSYRKQEEQGRLFCKLRHCAVVSSVVLIFFALVGARRANVSQLSESGQEVDKVAAGILKLRFLLWSRKERQNRRHEILVSRCLVLSRMVGTYFKWNEYAADGMADRLSLFRRVPERPTAVRVSWYVTLRMLRTPPGTAHAIW